MDPVWRLIFRQAIPYEKLAWLLIGCRKSIEPQHLKELIGKQNMSFLFQNETVIGGEIVQVPAHHQKAHMFPCGLELLLFLLWQTVKDLDHADSLFRSDGNRGGHG